MSSSSSPLYPQTMSVATSHSLLFIILKTYLAVKLIMRSPSQKIPGYTLAVD